MSEKKIATFVSTATVVLALSALVASSTAWAGGGTRLEARMDNPDETIASCKAKWEEKGGRRTLSVECEDTGAVSANFMGCGISRGLPTVLEAGADFDLNLDTRDGDAVPVCSYGGGAVVDLTAEDGTVTSVSGRFEEK